MHNPQVEAVLSKKNLKESLETAHITLAHKASHGASAVAAYAPLRGTETQLQLTALLFTEKLAAMEVQLVPSGGEKAVISKNEWPHLTVPKKIPTFWPYHSVLFMPLPHCHVMGVLDQVNALRTEKPTFWPHVFLRSS